MRLRSLPSLATATPRRLTIALAGLLVSIAVAVGSGANFNSVSASPGSLIKTGTLVLTDSRAGQSVVNLSAVKPGTTTSGTVDVNNGGDVPAAVTLAPTNLANLPASNPLSSRLALEVHDLGDPACTVSCPASVTVYSGTLGSMGTLALGTFAAGATHRYTFIVTFADGGPNGADNVYGGAATTVDFLWTGTQ